MRLGKGVEGQASVQVTLEAGDGGRIGLEVLFAEGRRRLVGLCPIILVEDGLQLWLDRCALLVGHIAEHVVHFVLDAALAGRRGELALHGVEHGLVAIRDPQINLRDAAGLELLQQIFPGTLVLTLADGEGQHLARALVVDADHGQNRHFLACAVVDHREVSAVGEHVGVVRFQRARLPGLELLVQRVEHARHGGGARLRASEGLDHLPHPTGAGPIHEHLTDGRVQFPLTPMIALKELGLKPFAGPRHGHGFDFAHRRDQVAGVRAVALVAPGRRPGVGKGPNKGRDLFLQDSRQCDPNRQA